MPSSYTIHGVKHPGLFEKERKREVKIKSGIGRRESGTKRRENGKIWGVSDKI